MHPNYSRAIFIFLFLPPISPSSAGVEVTVYGSKGHSCYNSLFSLAFIPGVTCFYLELDEGECYTFRSHNERISSIDTHENCVVVWEHPNCAGESLRMFPGSPSHHDLSQIAMRGYLSWDDEISSISPCRECSRDQFRCKGEKCISKNWLCDGDLDCPHGDDEWNCPAKSTTQTPTTTTTIRTTTSTIRTTTSPPQTDRRVTKKRRIL